MRVVLQRVTEASVTISGQIKSAIGPGFLILLGICDEDLEKDAAWLAKKIAGMRVFSDAEGKMNLSLGEVNGEVLVISQFTLYASTRKGNRPGFTRAARPEKAVPLYAYFVKCLERETEKKIETGVFGADMKIHLINDGPVTIIIDSQLLE
jgi:D-aminoacyl-tRNA deacylase